MVQLPVYLSPVPTRLQRLQAERERIRTRLRQSRDPDERRRLDDALFELRCAIRVERERAAGVRWRCEECGFSARPSEWLEFCPECGGRWQ